MITRHSITLILSAISLVCFNANVFAQYQLRTQFGDTLTCKYRAEGIFAIWWDAKYDHDIDAGFVLDSLLSIQAISLNELGLQNPPNPGDGYYYNVYLHHGNDDLYPSGWGNGQGTDSYGYPYLTLPYGFHLHPGNIKHEGLHIFQYSANSPGFAYAGDSAWYIEASANWFAATQLPDFVEAFLEAASVPANPQMPLWRAFFNGEASDPDNWQRAVHQYGMNILLYYLTEVAGVPTSIILGGFYANTTLTPQGYLSEQIGSSIMREYYTDWAAHNTAGFDYITAEQWARAQFELSDYGDSTDIHDIVQTFTNEGTGGEWYRPGEDYVTRGWSYNVYKIENSSTDVYSFHLDGDESGSAAGEAFFEGRVVVMSGGTATYHALEMKNGQDGMKAINVTAADNEIFLVVAATPGHFEGNQTYSYRIKIHKGYNNAPVISALPDVTFLEDDSFTLSLDSFSIDIENSPEEMTWSAVILDGGTTGSSRSSSETGSSASDLMVAIDNQTRTATFRGTDNYFTTTPAQVTLTATDPDGLSSSDTIDVTITAVNDAPGSFTRLQPLDGSTLSLDKVIFSWSTAIDVDGDTVSYSLNIKVSGIDTIFATTDTTSLTVDFGGFGLADQTYGVSWSVTASDGQVTTAAANGTGTLDVITGVEDEELAGIPEEFALQQNYPNPFNPETTIRYQLPESANVLVKIYNLKGQLVRTLVNENKEAGFHEIVWDARDETDQSMPSGVYFYRIQAGDFVEVKRLTLLR